MPPWIPCPGTPSLVRAGLTSPTIFPQRGCITLGPPMGSSEENPLLWHDRRRDAGATIFRRLAASRCATADCDRFLLHRPSPAFSSASGSDLVSRLREEHLSRCGLPASGN